MQKNRKRKLTNSASNNKPKSNKFKLTKSFHKLSRHGKKEYYIKLPDNKYGGFLNKRRSFIPSFLKNSWNELKGVTWPNRSETIRLSTAVFIFAILFGIFIGIIDYLIDNLFRGVLLP